jgi:hypothetical protein
MVFTSVGLTFTLCVFDKTSRIVSKLNETETKYFRSFEATARLYQQINSLCFISSHLRSISSACFDDSDRCDLEILTSSLDSVRINHIEFYQNITNILKTEVATSRIFIFTF